VLSNEALMTAYQNGDVAAFAELVARHEKPLWNFLRRFVSDAATAEDLLQESFMRVVRGAPEWKPSAKFSTWLYTIGRNLCVDHARRMSHRRALSLDGPARESAEESGRGLYDKLAGLDAGGEKRALTRELATALERAIAALPEPQREVFVMREVLNLPFAEIAQALATNEATVKSRMRYALERLRAALGSLHDEEVRSEVAP
jgi:RNA polymerase sigma-70 factor (ECF subfamily)